MEGLLFLLLMGWIFKNIRKTKAPKKKMQTVDRKPERVVLDENQKEKIQQARQKMQQMMMPAEEMMPVQPAEGECAPEHMHSSEGEYRGSMETVTTEGMDFCDPALEHVRQEMKDPESVYANEIGSEQTLDLSPQGIYQGVVMSEILSRPVCRRSR